ERRFWHALLPLTEDFASDIGEFTIYNLNVLALRGIAIASHREPLGVNGENLDVLVASLDESTRARLIEGARFIEWFDDFEIDVNDERKLHGHKLGRSTSRLYFKDRFMRPENNVFSAENANEGILHILFYLALFMSAKT